MAMFRVVYLVEMSEDIDSTMEQEDVLQLITEKSIEIKGCTRVVLDEFEDYYK
jgi:hypothetical protein